MNKAKLKSVSIFICCIGYVALSCLLKNIYNDHIAENSKPRTLCYQTMDQIQSYLNTSAINPIIDLPHQCQNLKLNFINNFKNPCWLEKYGEANTQKFKSNPYFVNKSLSIQELINEKNKLLQSGIDIQLKCLPYYFLLGQPKSGTTDLYNRMVLHPQVSEPLMKGPNWWTRRRYGFDYFPDPLSFSQYLDIFTPLSHYLFKGVLESYSLSENYTVITGDSSTSSLWDHGLSMKKYFSLSNKTALNMMECLKNILPQCKFIVILRNPVHRLYSDFLYFAANESDCNPDKFHELVLSVIANWRQCVADASIHACAYQDDFTHSQVRIAIGMYAVFFREWFSYFQPSHFKVIKFEEYRKNTKSALSSVFGHLELRQPDEAEWQLILSSPVKNRNRQYSAMHNKTMKLLRQFYAPFNRELASLLQSHTYLWEE